MMEGGKQLYKLIYYMAVSHKDWELLNSRIWLTEIDIDRGLDFPILWKCQKAWWQKKK